MSAPDEQTIVLAVLARFGSDRDALQRFLDVTGLDVRAVRAAMADGSLTAGLFHHLGTNEDLLLDIAGDLGVRPEIVGSVVAARHRS